VEQLAVAVEKFHISEAHGEPRWFVVELPELGLGVLAEEGQLGVGGPAGEEGLDLGVESLLDGGLGGGIEEGDPEAREGRGPLFLDGGIDGAGEGALVLEAGGEALASEHVEGGLEGDGVVGAAAGGSPAKEQGGGGHPGGLLVSRALAGLFGDGDRGGRGSILAPCGLEESVD
jgi:hypothetical protein